LLNTILIIFQFFLTITMGLYFFSKLKEKHAGKSELETDSAKELDKLHRLKQIHLTTPLCEKTRPTHLDEVVGQKDGIRALKAALCGPNPQHILIYGPPGVGKTAAARAVLKEAILSSASPFRENAPFVEIDATTLRFDERGIADPLMGSVHDPIYQGAGAYGPAGIPQPKPGAVTKAHGGILFLDEIGELHPTQMNKLLKVLEDRTVFLESSYYASGNRDIPPHIHEIFQKGLPADFRLVGATTRSPEELPPALRSRCVEIYFSPLSAFHVQSIAETAAIKAGFTLTKESLSLLCKYAQNGRDAVNLVQTAGSIALLEGRTEIKEEDIRWVASFGHYSPHFEKKIAREESIGTVSGLAVTGDFQGSVIDIEASALPCAAGCGKLTVTGIVESQELEGRGQRLIRGSSARASIQNMLTVLEHCYGIDTTAYHIHVNLPGGTPIDGPSAGVAILSAVYSAIFSKPIDRRIAMTGELSIHGHVLPVGGVAAKVLAADKAGIQTVLIPKDNQEDVLFETTCQIVPVSHIGEVFQHLFTASVLSGEPATAGAHADSTILIAKGHQSHLCDAESI